MSFVRRLAAAHLAHGCGRWRRRRRRSSACLTRTMASRFRFGRVRGKAPRRGSNASAGAALHDARGVSCVKTTRIVAVHRVMNVRQLLGMPEVCEQQQGVATGGVSAGAFRVVLYTDALRLLFTRELGAAGFQLWTVTFPVCNGFNDVSSSSSSSSRPVGLGRGTRPSRARRVRAGRATSEVRGALCDAPRRETLPAGWRRPYWGGGTFL